MGGGHGGHNTGPRALLISSGSSPRPPPGCFDGSPAPPSLCSRRSSRACRCTCGPRSRGRRIGTGNPLVRPSCDTWRICFSSFYRPFRRPCRRRPAGPRRRTRCRSRTRHLYNRPPGKAIRLVTARLDTEEKKCQVMN